MRGLCVIAMCMVMVACSNERMYQILGSPPPQGPPTIYPLNFPICPLNWAIVVVPLRIVIYKDAIPKAEPMVGLMKRNPGRDPCDLGDILEVGIIFRKQITGKVLVGLTGPAMAILRQRVTNLI